MPRRISLPTSITLSPAARIRRVCFNLFRTAQQPGFRRDYQITINNRRLNKANFEQSILMPLRGDFRDEYRREYNQMLLDKATGANGIVQEKYLTISVVKRILRKPGRILPAWEPTSFPISPPSVPNAPNWTRRKSCASSTTSTGRARKLLSTLIRRI